MVREPLRATHPVRTTPPKEIVAGSVGTVTKAAPITAAFGSVANPKPARPTVLTNPPSLRKDGPVYGPSLRVSDL